ncbi:hypothetical protein A2125_01995 [Candidatus Woesebacteria bacterium GWB1_43_5]|uniref:DUF3048 domain-containing protein n=1 Tax=Candidatus Woesebacteria bacterium GWB1_43_5 TaxID=1802474 RepID=A0A1F7WSK7_9BACT|nr:MAG: hypothetical protein A2125_01995 [Candidatus Woesebacteria bacterium GWB1_43_5]
MKIITLLKAKLASKKVMTILSFLGLYFLSTGVSLAVFSYLGGNPSVSWVSGSLDEARSKINTNLPKTEECPINGEKFTKVEKDIWSNRRPITAVIENHLDSRPPSGLSRADVVYEVVAEGGITRFLGVFYCGTAEADTRIGPIRSARVYLVNWAAEYADSPLFVHSGGANTICKTCPGGVKSRSQVAREVDAFSLLTELGWRYFNGNALDAGTNIGYPEVWRDYERILGAASEHTYMGSTDKLYDVGIERGFGYKNSDGVAWNKSFSSWKFVDGAPQTPTASKISFEFWSNKADYNVVWEYDKTNNIYKRSNGGKEHIDLDNKARLQAKNVVIQFVKERGPVDQESHMFYEAVGQGKALIFQNGSVIEGAWKKSSLSSRTKFFDSKGAEVSFVRGPIWIEAVPAGNEIDY